MKKDRISLWLYILFLLAAFGLPFFSFGGYSIVKNTTSHLGAQGSPHSWLMNAIFVFLGARAIWIAFRSAIPYHQIIGGVFGVSLILTGLFQHAPLAGNVPADLLEYRIHSIFASMTGFSFTLLAAGHGFMSRGPQRAGGFALALAAVSISLSMAAFPSIMGLLQRIMFICAFGWLFFYLKPPAAHG